MVELTTYNIKQFMVQADLFFIEIRIITLADPIPVF